MRRVFRANVMRCQIRAEFRQAVFGDRTRCPRFGYAWKLWQLECGRCRCKGCRKRFGLLTDTWLAHTRFKLRRICDLLVLVRAQAYRSHLRPLGGRAMPTAPTLPAKPLDLAASVPRQTVRAAIRAGEAVLQSLFSLRLPPLPPLVDGGLAHTHRCSHIRRCLSGLEPLNYPCSPGRRQLRILMNVHRCLRRGSGSHHSHTCSLRVGARGTILPWSTITLAATAWLILVREVAREYRSSSLVG